ncbi:unnamed protein product [Clonostachys rhizophaga]|uniref:ATP synthase F(0) complex subunit e, mitochondrial n=1 Tax=Clonostachys rhizophaga TaxID=160324 RepID=A0A9N9V5I9_9HYPO|nr:unnamed protein product [Clonostachys rhizophaga]
MASTGVNVLRWSALAVGVFYGFSHQRSITAAQRAQHDQHEYQEKQKKIDQAKAEYAKQKNPAPASSSDGMSAPVLENPSLGVPFERLEGPRAQFEVARENPTDSRILVITDPTDPKFDLEKLLLKVSEQKA